MDVYTLFRNLSKFNFIKHEQSMHMYYDDQDKQYRSVSSLLAELDEKDWDKISFYVARNSNRTQSEVKKDWESRRRIGTDFHTYVENYLKNKIVFLDIPPVLTSLWEEFYRDYILTGFFIPVKTEFIIADREYRVAGTIDQLMYSPVTKKVHIFDWKTNKTIPDSGSYYPIPELAHLRASKFTGYALQLSIYKYILDRNTDDDLEIGHSIMAHFSEKEEKLIMHKMPFLTKELNYVLQRGRNNT